MNKKFTPYIAAIMLGSIVAAIGTALAITQTDPQGIMQGLPFALIGIGLGAFGGGMGGAISTRTLDKNRHLAKQKAIEINDERNIKIATISKAKTFEITTYLFGALIIFLALMQVALVVIIVFIAAFFLRMWIFLFYLNKFHKEM